MGIDSREGIIQQVNVCIVVYSSSQADALLLASTQVNALQKTATNLWLNPLCGSAQEIRLV